VYGCVLFLFIIYKDLINGILLIIGIVVIACVVKMCAFFAKMCLMSVVKIHKSKMPKTPRGICVGFSSRFFKNRKKFETRN